MTAFVLPLALAAVAQPPGLTLTNVRSTYGPFGSARPPGPLSPGDFLHLAFDINGVKVADGKATYTMAMVVKDAAGKAWYEDKPAQKTDFVPLGGSTLPGIAYTYIGFEQPPGNYTVTLTVSGDGSRPATITYPFTIAPKGLAIVSVGTSQDDRFQHPVPNGGFVGQTLVCHFNVVGFARDDADRRPGAPKPGPGVAKQGLQPNVLAEMTFSESGKPLRDKPEAIPVEGGLAEDAPAFNLKYAVPLTRVGKFAITLTVTDRIVNKKATFTLPITVSPPPG
jgi:hypothetical protein